MGTGLRGWWGGVGGSGATVWRRASAIAAPERAGSRDWSAQRRGGAPQRSGAAPRRAAHRHAAKRAARVCGGRQLERRRVGHAVSLDEQVVAGHVGHQDVQQLEAQAGAVDGEGVARVVGLHRPVEQLARGDDWRGGGVGVEGPGGRVSGAWRWGCCCADWVRGSGHGHGWWRQPPRTLNDRQPPPPPGPPPGLVAARTAAARRTIGGVKPEPREAALRVVVRAWVCVGDG